MESTTGRSLEVLDSTTSILGDSLVIAPLVQTADLHFLLQPTMGQNRFQKPLMINSGSGGRTYFYMFDINVSHHWILDIRD